jgi:hypothetical protein
MAESEHAVANGKPKNAVSSTSVVGLVPSAVESEECQILDHKLIELLYEQNGSDGVFKDTASFNKSLSFIS